MSAKPSRGAPVGALPRALTARLATSFGVGALGALAFPFVCPPIGGQPLLDALPRELLTLLVGAHLYGLTLAPVGPVAPGTRPYTVQSARAFAAGLGFFTVLIYWLIIAMAQFGGLPVWQSVLLLSLLVAFCALFWALVPAFCRALSMLGMPAPERFATSMVIMEWLRECVGFPWGAWGYAQARNLPLVQLASVGGVALVTWWVAYMAARARDAYMTRSLPRGPLALLVLTLCFGAYRMGQGAPQMHPGEAPLRLALVQGNIAQDIKNQSIHHQQEIVDVYSALTLEAEALGAQLVLWPEAAYPEILPSGRPLPKTLRGAVPRIVGAATYDAGPPQQLFNSALYIDPDGVEHGRYHKRHLVPFGEYVPFRGFLPIDKVVPGLLDLTPGDGARLLGPKADIGAVICYDGVFGTFTRDAVGAGATWLVNLTNDAWYGLSSAPYQHRDFYVLRAIETDRWVMRATNTGISLGIDPRGGQHHATALGTRGLWSGHVTPRHTQTLYVRLGDWVVWASLGALGASACVPAVALVRRRRKER